MAKWQPPIPAGALYSPHAIALGPGLALLAWCYDQVLRDGSVQLNLEKAAADLGTPYGTVRDWWRRLKGSEESASPFFSEITPQGRKGWRVTFKTRWIDWRIIEQNYPQRQDFSDDDENTADIPAVEPDRENTAELIAVSSQNNRRDLSDQASAYKVLIPTDQAVFADAAIAAPRERVRTRKTPDRTPDDQAYLDRKKAIETAYVAALGYKPAAFAAEAKAAKWLAEQNYTPDQVVGCYEHLRADSFYDKKHIRLQTVANQIGAWLQTNRQRPARASPGIPLIQAPPVNAKPKLSAEETRAILAEYNPRFRT